MITICKDQIYPHCAIVEGLPFKYCFSVSIVLHRSLHCSENGVSSCQYLRGLCYQRHKEPGSLLMCVPTKMFISLNSWCRVSRQEPRFPETLMCVCVCVFGLKRVAMGGESKLFAHVQTSRMDEDTDGISLWWTFLLTLATVCLERHGNLSWNGQASYWMREDLGLSPNMVWMGYRRQAVVCVGWGFVEMRSVLSEWPMLSTIVLSHFDCGPENMFLDSNDLTDYVYVCPDHVVDWYEMVVCTIVVWCNSGVSVPCPLRLHRAALP